MEVKGHSNFAFFDGEKHQKVYFHPLRTNYQSKKKIFNVIFYPNIQF